MVDCIILISSDYCVNWVIIVSMMFGWLVGVCEFYDDVGLEVFDSLCEVEDMVRC